MSKLLYHSFELTRNKFIERVEPISNEMVDIIPNGFNNNIHWLVGHVLTVTERFLFGVPTTHIPANYNDLFGNGTKPADWNQEVPTVEELLVQLKDQLLRAKEIPTEKFEQLLEKPLLGLNTFGELYNMAIFHEANHLGQIQSMKRLIETNSVN